ncbi:MAG: helix-turn-helix domain-containing protein [Candidatus Magasanikbacteria bacterium]|nr:helix-turn-helix domain-containing protein [Candidatus Magasanikbacteria bacterium]
MDDTKTSNSKEMVRVSISEAARLFGVNTQTVRRAIRSQEVTYVIVGGRYKINFESLVKWSQRHTTVRNKLAKKGIGQFVNKWKIKNPLFSPNPKSLPKPTPPPDHTTATSTKPSA